MKNERDYTASSHKKNLLILVAVILFVIVVLAIFVVMAGKRMEGFSPDEELIAEYYEQHKDLFKTPDFQKKAEDDESYMQDYDRRIYYLDGPIRSELLPDEDLPMPALSPIVNMISIIIEGDSDAYNSLFTFWYITEKGMQAPFTAQKPYNIEITYVGPSNGGWLFKLNYCLKDNDGTLRKDVLSDMSRTLNITVIEVNGAYYIESIGYHFASR